MEMNKNQKIDILINLLIDNSEDTICVRIQKCVRMFLAPLLQDRFSL